LIARRVLFLMSMAKLALSRRPRNSPVRSKPLCLLFIIFPIARRLASVAFFCPSLSGHLRRAATSKDYKGTSAIVGSCNDHVGRGEASLAVCSSQGHAEGEAGSKSGHDRRRG
jgi:hypothetical protein